MAPGLAPLLAGALALAAAQASPPTTAPAAPPPSAPAADGDVLDRVVAVLRSPASPEPRIVTLSRVEEEARIALVGRGAVLAATQPLDAPALHAGLEWVIDQTLLGDEAARLQVFEADRAEIAAEVARFRERFPGRAAYDAFLRSQDLGEEELGAILGRTLRVRRYVESRVALAGAARVADEVGTLVRDLRARADVRVLDDLSRARPRP